MAAVPEFLQRLRGLEVERMLGLRPVCPQVVLALEGDELALVRLKRRRRGRPLLEAHRSCRLEAAVPLSMAQNHVGSLEELTAKVQGLFQASGTRPGRVAVILPDNLCKISLLQLPERPPSRRHLEELVRFKIRRAVPFRLDEATLSYQLLPGEGKGVGILVAVARQGLLAHYERALEAAGARPGLVDLSTPNLLNLCRAQIDAAAQGGGDVALLNCSRNYFSLLIVRDSRLIFFRCKTYVEAEEGAAATNGMLARELSGSFSYYQEKLAGQNIRSMLVRSVGQPFEELARRLGELGVERVEPIDPVSSLELAGEARLDAETGQRIAPAVGAAVGRT